MYKLKKRLKEIKNLSTSATPDYLKIARIYEKCGDEMHDLKALELAMDYYKEMLKFEF